MKLFVLILTFSVSLPAFAARDAVSQATATIVEEAMTILSLKTEQERFTQLCGLLERKLQNDEIAGVWLGQYQNIATDQSGVREFQRLIPSIVMTKLMQGLGSSQISGSVTVDESSTDKGNGVYEVSVSIDTGEKTYTGTAVMKNKANVFRLMDGRYMGFSVVDYLKSEYQDYLAEEGGTTPVTGMVTRIKADPDFKQCP